MADMKKGQKSAFTRNHGERCGQIDPFDKRYACVKVLGHKGGHTFDLKDPGHGSV